MKWKNNKGIAMPMVVVLMAVVLCFSLLIITLVLNASLSNKYQSLILQKQIVTAKIYDDFIDDGDIDCEYDLYFQIIENENNANQKALVVKKTSTSSATNLYYLCIRDFEQNKTLANQTENFSITKRVVEGQEYYYLADLIKYCLVE